MSVSVLGKRTYACMQSVTTGEQSFAGQIWDFGNNVRAERIDSNLLLSAPASVIANDVSIYDNVIAPVAPEVSLFLAANDGGKVIMLDPIEALGDINMGGTSRVRDLPAPLVSGDAARKAEVDSATSTANSALTTANSASTTATTANTTANAALSRGGGTMTGGIAMGGNKITGLGSTDNANDAATKAYVDAADALQLNLTGGTLSGALLMGANKIATTGFCLPWTQWFRTTSQSTKGAIVWSTVDGSPEYYQPTATDPTSTHTMMVGANGSQMRFTSGFFLFVGTFTIEIYQQTPAVVAESVSVLFRDGANIHIQVDEIIPFGGALTVTRAIPFIGLRSNAGNTSTFRMEWTTSNPTGVLKAARLCIFRIN